MPLHKLQFHQKQPKISPGIWVYKKYSIVHTEAFRASPCLRENVSGPGDIHKIPPRNYSFTQYRENKWKISDNHFHTSSILLAC